MCKHLTLVALIGLFFAGQVSATSHTDPDFNDDGIVNELDLRLLISNWGTRAGGPNWDAKIDLNSDGIVDELDLRLLISNWGKTFPVILSERDVLVALYNATGGVNWTNSTHWLSSNDISTWHGVSVSNGLVTGLDLSNNNLMGEIPAELGNLTNLTRLDLSFNSITDVSALSGLTNLAVLGLDNNSISDLLPLIANRGLGSGDRVDVRNNPLSAASLNTHIPALQNRGVNVLFDTPPKIYWTDLWTGTIQRANLDGSGVEDLVTHTGGVSLALDSGAGKMYWTVLELDKIQRANLDGSGIEDLVTQAEAAFGLALDLGAGKMYWTGRDKIQRANLDGSGVEDLVITRGTDNDPFDLALVPGAGKMYWTATEGGTIRRANLDGSGVEDLVTGLGGPFSLALDLGAGKMYWTAINEGKIQRANLNGSDVEDLITGLGETFGLALDPGAGKMYWTVIKEDKAQQKSNTIRRANLDGSGVEDFITGLYAPGGLALDLGNQGGDVIPPPPEDREALVALYNATNGSGWTDKTNWLSDRPLGEWYGVTANAQDRVTRLVLDNNNLTGAIPSELGNLASLEVLALWYNNLTGTIPAELGDLANLQSLFLSHNNLTGAIPSELGNLANLETLVISHNNLTGAIPSELGNLANLETLVISHNNLTGAIPSELGNLANLTGLYLEDNSDLFGPLPETLTALGKLQALNTINTQLCIPSDPAFLAWLQSIEAGGRLCVVRMAVVSGGGQRAVSGTRLPQPVEVQAIGANDVPVEYATVVFSPGEGHGTANPDEATTDRYGIVQTFWTLGQVVGEQTLTATVEGQSVQVVATATATATDREALVALYNATNGSGWTNKANWLSDRPIGEWHGVTTDASGRVVRLSLEVNNLKGPIPSQLGNLANLTHLYLTTNNLTGPIPPSLGNLANLEVLSIQSNNLTGPIPPSLGRLVNLQRLYLGNNQLAGTIPRDFTLLCNLRYLYLHGNALSELPSSAHPCFGQELEVLHLHDNDFLGPFPPWLANLTSLTYLTLGGPSDTCVPANDGFRAWVRDLHQRGALAESDTPTYCGEGFWFTWRFEQTTTGRSWTGARPFAAHRIRGKPMLLRIFMGMQNNNHGSWGIQSPRMKIMFYEGIVIDTSEPTVDVPAGAIPLWATRDQAFLLDPSYRQSINILIPGHLPMRGRSTSIRIEFDPDNTFREIVGNRMPALHHDPQFAHSDWVRMIDYGQTYEILSGYDANPRAGWPIQEMPPAKVYLMPLMKSQSDDRGMIRAINDLVRKGPSHSFFWETQNLLPIKDLTLHSGRGLMLGYHPTDDNKLFVLSALEASLLFRTWDNEFDYIVGLIPEGGGIANGTGGRLSVVGYKGGSPNNALAHELGHNMDLGHAPCGVTGFFNKVVIDDSYPWDDGKIGGPSVRGVDLGIESLRRNHVRAWDGEYVKSIDRPMLLDPDETEFIVDGDTPDLMSYCREDTYPRQWISAYHFDKALNYRQPATSKPATSTAPVNALLLSGGQRPDGEMFLWPAFVGEASPQLPQEGGQYRIGGQDAQGRELFSFDFDMTEVADGEGASLFVFAVPVRQEWANALARITLTGPEGAATLDRDGAAAAVLLRDSTGEVRGILRDWKDSALTASAIAEALGDPNIKDWDVQISRGIPNASYWKR